MVNQQNLQLIDDQQQFNPEFASFLKNCSFKDPLTYHVVSVFGSQSSGKSTLLNKLFATSFEVMSEISRQQTTKGIWVSRKDSILIMDVEGTDGREHGEDQDFERKSALFSISTSEVLIINIWEHSIGLYNGANMGLLKTVFEVNLQLFAAKDAPKTLLLFAIRDYLGATPLTALAETVTTDLNKIWESISKPNDLVNSKVGDFFILEFYGIPHKILKENEFENSCKDLAQRFLNPSHSNYLFLDACKKAVPIDGLYPYTEAIWEKILNNRDLDLPTQQELLAQFRCDDISNAAFNTFNSAIVSISQSSPMSDFGVFFEGLRTAAMTSYETEAHRYNKTVFMKKKDELFDKINNAIYPFFIGQLRLHMKKALCIFVEEMKTFKGKFAVRLETATRKALEYFENNAKINVLPGTLWSYATSLEELKEELRAKSDMIRNEAIKITLEEIKGEIESAISEQVHFQISTLPENLWERIVAVYKSTMTENINRLAHSLEEFCLPAQHVSDIKMDILLKSFDFFILKIRESLPDDTILLKLRTKFEEKFRYDSKGLPRVWNPSDDIDALFAAAKEPAILLLEKLVAIKISPEQFNEFPDLKNVIVAKAEEKKAFILLNENRMQSLESQFTKSIEVAFIDAKRSLISGTNKIPLWIVILLVILGWNELMAVLSSPLYFLMLILLIGGIYFVGYFELSGPLKMIVAQIFASLNSNMNVRNPLSSSSSLSAK